MSKTPDILSKKIKLLEEKVQEKNELLKKYKQALDESNERVKHFVEELEENLESLRKIHSTFIPTQLPKIPHFEFSYKLNPTKVGVSGDFFDVVHMKDPLKFGIILSNCETYALTSLLLSTFLKFSSQLKLSETSQDFTETLFENLLEHFSPEDSLNLFCGIVNRKHFTLDYCMVGSISAHVKSFDGDFKKLQSSQMNLDKNYKKSLKNHLIELKPKDYLLLCSPGLINKKNPKGETFGASSILKHAQEKPLKNVLEMRQNILFEADQFSRGKVQNQDETLLIMAVQDKILKLAKNKLL